MPSLESNDVATASNRRPKPGPGSKARDEPHARPIRDAILLAIKASGLSISRLARLAGVTDETMRGFVNGKSDLRLKSADKLANFFGITLVRQGRDHGAEARDEPHARPITDPLLMALKVVDGDGRSAWDLCKAAGVRHDAIRRFTNGLDSLMLATVDKLVNPLGLAVIRQGRDPASEARDEPHARPITDPLLMALKTDADDGRSAWKLGKAAGVKDQDILRFFRGERDMKLSTAEKLVVELGGFKVVGQDPGSETADNHPPRSIRDVILKAIETKGIRLHILARDADVCIGSIHRFLFEDGDLKLATVDKILTRLGLKLVRDPKPRPVIIPPQKPSMDEVRSAIDTKGLSRSELAKLSGVSVETIRSIQRGRPNLNLKYTTLAKLANALGFELDPPPSSAAGPISAPRDSTTNKDTSIDQAASISQARYPAGTKLRAAWPPGRCPVELQGEGRPILVYGQEIPRMNGVAYSVLTKLVDRFLPGGGCTPGELKGLTGFDRPLRLFIKAMRRSGFEPLRKVIPSWDARKGKILEIVDVGPG
jgi:transcriptional regulator with XRE-family HTH domain